MRCQRCGGLLIRETFDDLNIETHSLYSATRCINCGCIEDAVIRTNRFHSSERTRVIPRRRVRKGDVACIKIHSEEYASII
jgi:NADH:ubiquinone oxidoreductase subunit B-like Fe-S oxidoreductase